MDKNDQDLHVDEAYKSAFNDGYTLAKELGFNKETLQGISAGNHRMEAMKSGIEQFEKEVEMKKERDKILGQIQAQEKSRDDISKQPEKDKNKGMDITP